ncbi:MAG TPA: hypothetical protein VIM71_16180 [Lacunisphaera sp.]
MLTETISASDRAVSSGVTLLGNYRRTYADLRALDRALILEDLSAARDAFNRLQQDSPLIAKVMSRELFPIKSRPLRAIKALGRCLLRGNLSAARRAFELFA